jgi:hypothetical protein
LHGARIATLMPVATWPVIVQPTHFPHGELVEPRTAALPSGKSAALKAPRSNLQTKIIVATYPTPSNLSYPMPVLSMGSCFRSRSKVGKDGVSAGGQRTQALADLFVFGGQSAHFRQILPLLLTPTPIVRTLHRRRRWARTPGVHPLAPRNKQKLAGRGKTLAGGLRIALLIYQDALRRPPVFPQCKAMARRKSGRGKGKAHPVL